MLKDNEAILNTIPDFYNEEEALRWITQGQQLVQKLTPDIIKNAPMSCLEWNETHLKQDSPWGLYASITWRKFVLATFFADLVSYALPADQVNFDRLLYVMHHFPKGFRTWCIQLPNKSWWPVGYTGWYPMLETSFEQFEKSPEKLKDRMVVPQSSSDYLYLFNYSIVPKLKKTTLSSMLMKNYIQDIIAEKVRGIACITVSNDGIRIAHSLGMEHSGNLNSAGHSEGVFTKRY